MSSMTRRGFWGSLAASGLLSQASFKPAELAALMQAPTGAKDSPHIGNLYPFVQQQADRSPLELSFLHPRFRDLAPWQKTTRTRVLDHLFYSPPPVAPEPEIIRRTDRGDYLEEYLTFRTTPDLRVPAYVLIPRKAAAPAPGVEGGVRPDDPQVAVDDRHAVRESVENTFGLEQVAGPLARAVFRRWAIDSE